MARKLVMAVTATALSGGALIAATAPAHAAPQAPRTPVPYYNCKYPYVCFYDDVYDIVLRYKDVTSYYQSFNGTNVHYAVNTRNDDVAYIRYTNGDVACLPSGDPLAFYQIDDLGTPNGIRISSSATCQNSTPQLKKAALSK